jgi:hypothetical protein
MKEEAKELQIGTALFLFGNGDSYNIQDHETTQTQLNEIQKHQNLKTPKQSFIMEIA